MSNRAGMTAAFKAQVARGIPIVGAGAGTGISAKSAEMRGVNLIISYNSGRFHMARRGSLAGLMPYGDANQIVVEMARHASGRTRCQARIPPALPDC